MGVQLPISQKVVTSGNRAVDHEVPVLQHTIEPALKEVSPHRGNHTTGVQDMGEKALIAPAFVKADLSVEEDLETAVNRLGGGHIHKQCVVLNF